MIQSTSLFRAALAAAVFACLPAFAAAQQPTQPGQRGAVPTLPPGMSEAQLRAEIQNRGLGDVLRQRLQQSGLTPDQIRARLRDAGYPADLVDQYLGAASGRDTVPPSSRVLQATSAIGIADLGLALDTTGLADTLHLSRRDSFVLDSIGLVVGVDSIPSLRDSLGVLRIDSLGLRRLMAFRNRLRVFGLDVFHRTTTQFAPVALGPVDADYRVGAGDMLVLVVTGDVELTRELEVTREGFVVVPQVGQIFVANLTLGQLRDVLFTRLSRVYAGLRRDGGGATRFDITLSRVHVNQVFVTGDVAKPGAYAVSAVGTAMNALYQAGGPTERGDFRGVRIMRAGRPVATLDLYDYILHGDTRNDVRLEQGDVVFVPPRGRRVSIAGAVVRPAIYDMAGTDNLREAIQIAGGLLADAYTGHAQIWRILPSSERGPGGLERTMIDVDLDSALAPAAAPVRIEPGDSISVLAVAGTVMNRLSVTGNVWHPGSFRYEPGMRLSQLLREAGGPKPDAYLEAAHIVRLMPDSSRRLVAVDLRRVLGGAGGGGAAPNPPGDVVLQEFDSVVVYSRSAFRPNRRIAIYGAVQKPGVLQFADSMTVRDAVMMAGGLTDDAYLLEAEISRRPDGADSTVLARTIDVPLDSSYASFSTVAGTPRAGAAAQPTLRPYDNVFIRRVPGWEEQRNVVVAGAVRFPGTYTLTRRDERVADVLARAGGLLPDAYAGGFQLHRASGRVGRIGVDLPRVMRDPSYRDNLALTAGDSLFVPEYLPYVQVEGAVNSPVAVAYAPGHDARWFVDRAGGFTRHADKSHTFIVQPNGAVAGRDERVEPGARVVVPAKPLDVSTTNWTQIIGAVAPIVTSLVTLIIVLKP